MKNKFKLKLRRLFWPLVAFHRIIMRKKSFLHKTGWVESFKRGYPCDKEGSYTPWMNYSVIHFLKDRLKSDMCLFEYGSGYSTLFYAPLVREVNSVEYNQGWFDHMKQLVPKNVVLAYQTQDIDADYCRAIMHSGKKFDVIIVDGRDRVNCVIQAIAHLSEHGVIILDDSSRERYIPAMEHAKKHGFRAIDFEGFKPTGSKIDRTTIFYRDENCFSI